MTRALCFTAVRSARRARWLSERGADLSEDDRAYIRASAALARRSVRIRRAALALIASLALFVVWSARRESYRAHTETLVEQARARQEDRLDLALLLGLEVDRRGDELEARRLLSEGLESGTGLETFLHGHTADVRSIAWSHDGRSLVSASERELLLWNMDTLASGTAAFPRCDAGAVVGCLEPHAAATRRGRRRGSHRPLDAW